MKTLALRMERHNNNAMELANWLSQHQKINSVYYPGLNTNPGHSVAISQMKGFGGVLSFSLNGEEDLLSKKTVLSKEEYTKKTNTLRKKVIDYQSQRKSSLDKIATQRTEAREKLVEKLNPILDSYIKENNISLVMDKKDLLAGSKEFDITNVIVEKLDV